MELGGAGDPVWLLREALLFCRESDAGWDVRARASYDEAKLGKVWDVEDEVLWWRREVGIENPEPDKSDDSTMGSWEEVAFDVDEAFETTDALWAARSIESSRVRRFTCRWSVDGCAMAISYHHHVLHTTASCSFSSCM